MSAFEDIVNVTNAAHMNIMVAEVLCGILCGIAAFAVLYVNISHGVKLINVDKVAKISFMYVVVCLFTMNVFGDQLRMLLFTRALTHRIN